MSGIFIKLFQPEIGKTKFDQVTNRLELVQNDF